MNSKKQDTIDFGLLRNFLHFRLNIWIVVSASLILGSIFIYFLSLQDLIIFPDTNTFKFEFYNDSANGGNSIIIKQSISDSTIDLEFDLKEGFISPYVGIYIEPKKDSLINLARYNQFHLDIEGDKPENIGFSLFTRKSKHFDRIIKMCFYTNIEIIPERKQYDVNINQLKVPDWWYTVSNITPNEKIKPDLKQVLHFNIGTAYTPNFNTKSSLRIHSISFKRNNRKLIIILIVIELFVICLLVIANYLSAFFVKKTVPVTISYKPVDIENESPQLKGFLEYINSNFHKNDLTLEQVSNYTGINQRRIANTIHETFGCNFKTYVNRIRINESKRLLKESDLNMGEIAFMVGFNNQSHFNRVFKEMEGISPSEFRINKT